MIRQSFETSGPAKWIDQGIIGCLFLFACFAPNSIAITQSAWLIGMLLWVVRFALYPRPRLYRTPIDYALFGFFLLTGLSAFLSYEPMVSIGKLRAASLFTIVYLFAENVPSRRVIRLLALTLIAACMANVLFTLGDRMIGRGITVQNVSPESPLKLGKMKWEGITTLQPLQGGDVVVEVDGKVIRDVQTLANALAYSSTSSTANVRIHRVEWAPTLQIPRGRLLNGKTAEQQLGISGWSIARDWRASGFFGHFVTYAEALQLILALAIGLWIALPSKRSWMGVALTVSILGMGAALLLTVTRASWLAFLVSTAVIVLLGARRRTVLILGALAIPLILAGLFVLQQKRNVGFIDRKDDSITWRQTVWREGYHLLVSKPRHLLIGVGMDSLKSHWREWNLFDQGRRPMGHMHSDFLQLALERGVPALILWLVLLSLYAQTLWRLARRLKNDVLVSVEALPSGSLWNRGRAFLENATWIDRGIALGALGGLAGFVTSGLVHYNWGDSEVVMILYFIMGLCLALNAQTKTPPK